MLTAYTGKKADRALMFKALHSAPSLVLDCANCANPHTLFPFTSFESLHYVYVINIDLIYLFRDALKEAGDTARKLNANSIIITTFRHLFNYDDPEENFEIVKHSWELMKDLSRDFDVHVGIPTDPMNMALARRLCDKVL